MMNKNYKITCMSCLEIMQDEPSIRVKPRFFVNTENEANTIKTIHEWENPKHEVVVEKC